VGQGKSAARAPSSKRRKAAGRALASESKATTSKQALSRQAKQAATRRRQRGKATADSN
jgi:hypothetical protein